MKIEKDVQFLIDQMDEPERSQLINNHKNDTIFTEISITDTVSGIILSSFNWDNSPEKYEYWWRIYNKYRKKERTYEFL